MSLILLGHLFNVLIDIFDVLVKRVPDAVGDGHPIVVGDMIRPSLLVVTQVDEESAIIGAHFDHFLRGELIHYILTLFKAEG